MKALVNLTELDMYDNKIKDVGGALDLLVNVVYVVHLSLGRCLTPSLNLQDARSVLQLAAGDPSGTPVPSEIEDRLFCSGPDIHNFWT